MDCNELGKGPLATDERELNRLLSNGYIHYEGGLMRKSVKKTLPRRSIKTDERLASSELSTNQQRFLQLLTTGIEGEPDVLAGRR